MSFTFSFKLFWFLFYLKANVKYIQVYRYMIIISPYWVHLSLYYVLYKCFFLKSFLLVYMATCYLPHVSSSISLFVAFMYILILFGLTSNFHFLCFFITFLSSSYWISASFIPAPLFLLQFRICMFHLCFINV